MTNKNVVITNLDDVAPAVGDLVAVVAHFASTSDGAALVSFPMVGVTVDGVEPPHTYVRIDPASIVGVIEPPQGHPQCDAAHLVGDQRLFAICERPAGHSGQHEHPMATWEDTDSNEVG